MRGVSEPCAVWPPAIRTPRRPLPSAPRNVRRSNLIARLLWGNILTPSESEDDRFSVQHDPVFVAERGPDCQAHARRERFPAALRQRRRFFGRHADAMTQAAHLQL